VKLSVLTSLPCLCRGFSKFGLSILFGIVSLGMAGMEPSNTQSDSVPYHTSKSQVTWVIVVGAGVVYTVN